MSTLSLAPPFWRAFRVPKRGHCKAECEDACGADPARGRYAVADGATESSHAGLWAELLVQEFTCRDEPDHWISWLPELQKRWLARVVPAPGAAPLPWYAEVRLEEGAFATFLGLVLEANRQWRAWAVGDSCLFQVRDDRLIERLPMKSAAEFSSTPWLVGSRTTDEVPRLQGTLYRGGWLPGDRFWLMTDALAQWFLRKFECRDTPWRTLEQLVRQSETQFAEWVEQQRDPLTPPPRVRGATERGNGGRLRNDDVALVGVFL